MGSASFKRSRSVSGRLFLWIFVGCLACSLFIHLLFLERTRSWIIPGFSAANYDTIVPRTFRMKRVEIDPKTLEEEKPQKTRPENHPDVAIRKEVPLIVEGGVVNSKMSPMQKPTASESLEKPLDESRRNLPEFTPGGIDVHQEKTSGLNFPEKSLSPISLPEPKGKDGGGGSNSEILGDQKFSNIDDLLARSDALTAKTAPILMPTDLLFEYDASVLKDDATKSLKKLGELIKKNAQSSFRIEGHTDSFGSEEYNDQLSLRRAVAVKDWLIQNANIDPRNIATAGLGKRHLLVPASGNVQEQQLNRRVEIVITTR